MNLECFYSSGDAKGSHDVGVVVLGPRVRDKVISVRYVDNQMMMARLQGKKSSLSDSANQGRRYRGGLGDLNPPRHK